MSKRKKVKVREIVLKCLAVALNLEINTVVINKKNQFLWDISNKEKMPQKEILIGT